jgi:DNA-binding response OmpR family regulator
MDGIEVLDRIRRNPALESVVIMMLTSSDQVESAVLCRKMGVETYLIKPISSSDLLASIRLAIGVHAPASMVTLPAGVFPHCHYRKEHPSKSNRNHFVAIVPEFPGHWLPA